MNDTKITIPIYYYCKDSSFVYAYSAFLKCFAA
jgi:hypothetical protein